MPLILFFSTEVEGARDFSGRPSLIAGRRQSRLRELEQFAVHQIALTCRAPLRNIAGFFAAADAPLPESSSTATLWNSCYSIDQGLRQMQADPRSVLTLSRVRPHRGCPG